MGILLSAHCGSDSLLLKSVSVPLVRQIPVKGIIKRRGRNPTSVILLSTVTLLVVIVQLRREWLFLDFLEEEV